MEDFLRLHRLRWAAEGGSVRHPARRGGGLPPRGGAAPRARGWLRMYRLFVGQDAIAAVYGLEMGRRFFYYQSGYDPAWSPRSPGLVLVGRTVEDAYARGLTDYDFLRGTEPYKLDWASDRRETCSVRLRAPSLRAGTAAAAEEACRAARGLGALGRAGAGVGRAAARAAELGSRDGAGASGAARLARGSREREDAEGDAGARGQQPGVDPEADGQGAAAGALLVGRRAPPRARAARRREAGGTRVLVLSYHRATLDFETSARSRSRRCSCRPGRCSGSSAARAGRARSSRSPTRGASSPSRTGRVAATSRS